MKALLIISSLPDIIFIHADKGFVKHINKLSREAGFIGEDHNEDEMDTTALSQIFSPMITSLTYMNELGNPYSSILCEDGTLFVFRQVSVRIGSIFAILWVLPRRELGRNRGGSKIFLGGGALLRNGIIDWWRKQILIASTKKKAFK